MANLVRHISTQDFAQVIYQAGLRTVPAGIDSYRSIAQQEVHQVLELKPVFKGLVRFDDEYYDLGRLPETTRMAVEGYKAKITRGDL